MYYCLFPRFGEPSSQYSPQSKNQFSTGHRTASHLIVSIHRAYAERINSLQNFRSFLFICFPLVNNTRNGAFKQIYKSTTRLASVRSSMNICSETTSDLHIQGRLSFFTLSIITVWFV